MAIIVGIEVQHNSLLGKDAWGRSQWVVGHLGEGAVGAFAECNVRCALAHQIGGRLHVKQLSPKKQNLA